MMDFVAVEKGKIMAEYITCRRCDSPDCKGCNLKRLETMLENGKFDCLMNENRAIDTSADVATVRHGRWVDKPLIKSFKHTNIPVVECSECGIDFCDIINNHYFMYRFCPNCGARMDGDK